MGFRNGPVPLSPRGTLSEKGLEHGRRRLDWLAGKIQEEVGNKSRSPRVREFHRQLVAIGEMLRAHREELFAPNIRVRVGGGGGESVGSTGATGQQSESSMGCVTHAGGSREMVGERDKCSGKVPECCSRAT